MSLFVVDKEKCKRCNACVAECPTGIVKINYPNPIPTPIDGADSICIDCGHCVTVCPNGALAHRAMIPDECPTIRKKWLPTPEEIEHYMRARRSIRVYRKDVVEREVLEKLVNIARFAPTASNRQPVRWLVIYDSNEVHRLAGLVIDWMRHMLEENSSGGSSSRANAIVKGWEAGVDIICRGAPHLIIAYAPKDNSIASTDCSIALTHLDLAAPAFGLGTCWAGFLQAAASMWPPMQEALDLPEGNISRGAMMVGYPKYRYYRLPLRDEAQITWR